MLMKLYKVLFALQDIKIAGTQDNIVVGYNIRKKIYNFYTWSGLRLIYFDTASNKQDAMLKLQILR